MLLKKMRFLANCDAFFDLISCWKLAIFFLPIYYQAIEQQDLYLIQGQSGQPGATGSSGFSGATGPAGATGLTGLKGFIGSPGIQGSTGIQGATGFTGPQGT